VVELAKQLDDGKGLKKTVEDVKDANDRTALHFAAREGKTEVCQYLVEELKLDVNVKDAEGKNVCFVSVFEIIGLGTFVLDIYLMIALWDAIECI